jgi:ADP-heptose:LPS heptosyltransferase
MPICWGITVIYRIKKIFFVKAAISDPKKILFIKLFGLGSIILAIPSINAVRRKYPDASLYFLTFRENEAVLDALGLIPVQNVFTVRKDSALHFFGDIIRCLFDLIRERIDVVVDFEFFSRFTAILSFCIRSRYRIGFYGFHTEGLKRGGFIDYQVNYNHTLHTARVFFTLLKPLGIHAGDYDPSLPVIPPSAGFRENLSMLLKEANRSCSPALVRQWVIINPNTSDLIELRKWPGDHFVKLVKLLLDASKSRGVIFIGSAGEYPYVASLCSMSVTGGTEGRIVNLAGKTGIRDLIDLFHFADLMITNDSGPAHLASLTGIKSIVLFGPETPDLYAPLGENARCIYQRMDCQPCVTIYNSKLSYCRDNVCLHSIGPEQVFRLAVDGLTEASPLGGRLLKSVHE